MINDENLGVLLYSNVLLDIKHVTKDDSLAWGTVGKIPMYIRKLPISCYAQSVDAPPVANTTALGLLARQVEFGKIFITFVPDQGLMVDMAITYVFDCAEVRNSGDDCLINQLQPASYALRSVEVLPQPESWYEARTLFKHMMYLYVPFATAGQGGRMPIMYAIHREQADGTPMHCEAVLDLWRVLRKSPDKTIKEKVAPVVAKLKKELPSVDLDTQEDQRYVTIKGQGNSFFVYNRNHVAHNGADSGIKEVAPLLYEILDVAEPTPGFENLTRFLLCEDIAAEDVVVEGLVEGLQPGAGAGRSVLDEVAAEMSKDRSNNAGTVQVTGVDNDETNPLLRAAMSGMVEIKK